MTPDQDSTAAADLFARISRDGAVLRARLVGPSFGQREGPVVSSTVRQALEAADGGLGHVLLDFEDVEFVNSAGIGACIAMHKDAKTSGALLVLYGLRPDIREVFRVTRLDKLFEIPRDERRLAKVLGR